ncbi:MAG: hypothetical protein WBF93_08095, partial [Pirellulales bacterium]
LAAVGNIRACRVGRVLSLEQPIGHVVQVRQRVARLIELGGQPLGGVVTGSPLLNRSRISH